MNYLNFETGKPCTCTHPKVEKFWCTGSINEFEDFINYHLLLKDGTRKSFHYKFDLDKMELNFDEVEEYLQTI